MPPGILFPTDRDEPLALTQFEALEDYQRAVGRYVESVPIGQDGLAFFCHDEAKLFSAPMNIRATLLWWLLTPAARAIDSLAGPVVLVGPTSRSGTARGVPESIRQLLLAHTGSRYAVEIRVADNAQWERNKAGFGDYFVAAKFAIDLLLHHPYVEDIRVATSP